MHDGWISVTFFLTFICVLGFFYRSGVCLLLGMVTSDILSPKAEALLCGLDWLPLGEGTPGAS